MGRMVIGSGWHPRLFRLEASKIHGSFTALHPRILKLKHWDENLSRCSESKLYVRNAAIVPLDEAKIPAFLNEWGSGLNFSGSFAVRASKIGVGLPALSKRNVENIVGGHFFRLGHSVNLVNPETTIRVIMAGAPDRPQHLDSMDPHPLLVIGLDETHERPYMKKAMTSMPFFKPVTLDPKLASLLISLAYQDRNPPDQIIDPFCGTGCISLQARFRGITALSSDVDPIMVEGAKKNFRHAYGKESSHHPFETSDVSKLFETWGPRSNTAFIFDPPYARNSRTSESAFDVLRMAFGAAKEIDPEGVIVTILPSSDLDILESLEIKNNAEVMGRSWGDVHEMLSDLGWGIEMAIPTRVHSSLVRIVLRTRGKIDQN